MGIFKKDDTDYSKIKAQPYPSFEEEDREREEAIERAATEVNQPLTEEQKKIVREQADLNPVEQTVGDVLKESQKYPK